jgi:2'-5' RNA ligase
MTTGDTEGTARVFFALWPSPREQAALAAWQPALRALCGGKSMHAANLHATLVFLGNVALQRLEALKLAAQEVQGRKFEVAFDQARYWGHNHIVYAAPARVPAALAQLVGDLEQSLVRHRFRFDAHSEYQPHITLLRRAKWRDAPLPQMAPSRWHMESFALVQSVAGGEGVRYEVIAEFPLS